MMKETVGTGPIWSGNYPFFIYRRGADSTQGSVTPKCERAWLPGEVVRFDWYGSIIELKAGHVSDEEKLEIPKPTARFLRAGFSSGT